MQELLPPNHTQNAVGSDHRTTDLCGVYNQGEKAIEKGAQIH